jgi:hypothetical protein
MPCIGRIVRREIKVVAIIVKQETISKWFVSTLLASEQIVESEVRHHPHAHGQRRLVGEKER